MAKRHADVWWHEQLVGYLREDQRGLIHFAYAGDWLDQDGFPVSVNLPLDQGDELVPAHGFFAGLLPEGGTRQRICRAYQLDDKDDMGLLLAIGEDCAGALSILPAGQRSSRDRSEPEALDDKELIEIVRQHGTTLESVTSQPRRFSLAGAQEKLTVRTNEGRFTLANQTYPSSHILKFETHKRVCFAERMANQIATAMGLPVVPTEYATVHADQTNVPYLRIERYDRQTDHAGHLLRLHQEDALQALGEPASMKYQSDGGPSLSDIAGLVRAHLAQPARSLQQLRDWQIFNYLCGNWDGHAKNIALLYHPGESVPVLAPFYDLVAIEFLNLLTPGSYKRDMALYIGDHAEPERIGKEDWRLLARQLGMPAKPLIQRVEELGRILPDLARESLETFASEHEVSEADEQLEESIRRRCHWVLNSVLRE